MHNGLGFARNGFGDGVQTLSTPCGGYRRCYSIGRSGGDGFAPRIGNDGSNPALMVGYAVCLPPLVVFGIGCSLPQGICFCQEVTPYGIVGIGIA